MTRRHQDLYFLGDLYHWLLCYLLEPLCAAVLFTQAAVPPMGPLACAMAALILLGWLIHLRTPLKRWRGWTILPWTGRRFLRPDSLYVDRACMEETAVLAGVAAPASFTGRLTLRADSSSLLLSTAAALTHEQLPAIFREPLCAALAEVGVQPDRAAKRWTITGRTEICGAEAVIVRDGKGERFFLCAPPEMLLPAASHIWESSERPLEPGEAEHLLSVVGMQLDNLAPDTLDYFTAGYFTGAWTADGPATLTYLGAMVFACEPAEDVRDAIAAMDLPQVDQPGPRTLCIVREPSFPASPQMLPDDAPAASFADAHAALRERYRRRLQCAVFFPVMAFLLATGCIGAQTLPETAYVAATAMLLPMLDARLRGWVCRLPRIRWLGGLSIAVAMTAGLMLAFFSAHYTQAAGAFIAFSATAGWGFAFSVLARQKPARKLFLLLCAGAWGAGLFYAAQTASLVAALFGAVLSALCLLPVLTARSQA